METFDPIAQQKIGSSAFMNKVFSLFGLSILSTGVGVLIGFHFLLEYFIQNPLWGYALFGLELILVFSSRAWSQKVPLNYFLFTLFTLLSGITVVPLLVTFASEFGGYEIIYRALFATTAMFLSMALIGSRLEKPLLGLRGFLVSGLIGMVVTSIIGLIFPWGNGFEIVFSGLGVVLFSLFVMVDIQRLSHFHEDQYIQAAMELYLDIFNLFVFILRLTGGLSRK